MWIAERRLGSGWLVDLVEQGEGLLDLLEGGSFINVKDQGSLEDSVDWVIVEKDLPTLQTGLDGVEEELDSIGVYLLLSFGGFEVGKRLSLIKKNVYY